MTIYGYDGCTPLRNNFFSQVQGTIGNTVTVSQFDQHGKEYVTDQTTSVINAWANCNVGHTFAIPGMNLYVPVASPNAQLSANNLCSSSPCTPGGNPYAKETFSFMSPAHNGSSAGSAWSPAVADSSTVTVVRWRPSATCRAS